MISILSLIILDTNFNRWIHEIQIIFKKLLFYDYFYMSNWKLIFPIKEKEKARQPATSIIFLRVCWPFTWQEWWTNRQKKLYHTWRESNPWYKWLTERSKRTWSEVNLPPIEIFRYLSTLEWILQLQPNNGDLSKDFFC